MSIARSSSLGAITALVAGVLFMAPAAARAQSQWDAVIDKAVVAAGCRAPGSLVEFRIIIQNTGSRPLRRAVFSDVLPPGFTDVSVDGGLTLDPATNTVFTDPRTYGVGEGNEYTYRAVLPCTASGTLSNTGTFTFEDNSGNVYVRTDTEVVWWGLPDVTDSTKTWQDDPTDGDAIVLPGENVTFTIIVRNTGTCRALDVTVSDDLDPRFMSTTPPLVISNGGSYNVATGRVEWDATTTPQLASIPVGGSVSLTFTTQVEPGTAEGGFLPNSVTIAPLDGDAFCPLLPTMSRTVTLHNGDVAYGVVAPTVVLLRNDYVSCLSEAFSVIDGNAPDGIPVLVWRPDVQECSAPPAINVMHPQTDIVINPVSPHVFAADASWTIERCPQPPIGGGRMLVFYELRDDCTTTLRVARDPVRPWDVIVTW